MISLQWMLSSDPAVVAMVQRHLLDQQVKPATEGWIKRLYDLYVPSEHGWNRGVYAHKWISDHYTTLELLELEADGHDPRFIDTLTHLLDRLWRPEMAKDDTEFLDVCVAAMLLRMASYADLKDKRMDSIVDYLLRRVMKDGGWNCSWCSKSHTPTKSSLHTTLSVLEAIAMYRQHGYTYRLDELLGFVPEAEEFIFKKRLFRSLHDGEIISPAMIEMHFPVRWFYDAYRALLYFIDTHHPYDPRMDEAMERLKAALQKGPLPKGSPHGGMLHFKNDVSVYRAINTCRGLRIIKAYDPKTYIALLEK